ncbi:MAG: methyl-accepting chemotaxis protein [Spirochaetes bacterium]|nr:methyl-accepting chemotaxis protein [Spirochaetota bacterium]
MRLNLSFIPKLNFTWIKEKRVQLSLILVILLVFCQNSASVLLDIKRDSVLNDLKKIESNNHFLRDNYFEHLIWSVELLESIVADVDFKGQLNHNETDFAKWYYSFKGSGPYWDMDTGRRQVFDKMGQVNVNLFNSARMMFGESFKEKINIYNNETKKELLLMSGLFSDYINLNNNVLTEKNSMLNFYTRTLRITQISSSLVIIGIIILLIVIIIRSTIDNMKQYKSVLRKISGGDITTRLNIITKDEYGVITVYFNSFLERIEEIIKTVKFSSTSLADSSFDMKESIHSFSGNLQEQASCIEEINAVSDQIVKYMDRVSIYAKNQSKCLSSLIEIINKISDHILKMTEEMKRSAKETSLILKDAEYGEKQLIEMNRNMISIDESSQKITEIVKIINDISEKINLLSLNAAIEAARAGKSGGGFAVVAKEITKLAYETSESIKGIDSLIKNNVSETGKGLRSVSETTGRLKKVITGVDKIGIMINSMLDSMKQHSSLNEIANKDAEAVIESDKEIKGSIERQNGGIKEIAEAITSINKLVQENATRIEEINDNISLVKDMAFKLNSEINFFNTDPAN